MAPAKRRQEEGAGVKSCQIRIICSDLKTPRRLIASNVATVWKWWVWWYQWLADRNEGLTEQFCCKICSSWLALWNPKINRVVMSWSSQYHHPQLWMICHLFVVIRLGWICKWMCNLAYSDEDVDHNEEWGWCCGWFEFGLERDENEEQIRIRMGTRTLMWMIIDREGIDLDFRMRTCGSTIRRGGFCLRHLRRIWGLWMGKG